MCGRWLPFLLSPLDVPRCAGVAWSSWLCYLVLSMWDRSHSGISLLSVAAVVLCVQPLSSQEPPCTIRRLPVSFRDAQNLPLQDVSVADLEAKVRGQPVKILSIAPDPRPHRLVLILDASGSMGASTVESPPWNLELSLARHFFEVNRQRSQIAMVVFNEGVNDVVEFSAENSAIGERLQQIGTREYFKTHIKGRTALRDAIFRGIKLLDHPDSADAVYVLTDGGDNVSHHSTKELDSHLAVTSVRLFAVLVLKEARNRHLTPEEENGPRELAAMAQKSGGEILTAAEWHGQSVALSANVEAKANTEEVLRRLYQAILQDSLLEIELPFPISKDERWELRLSTAARRQWKNAQITYPDTLLSCNAEVFGSGRN